MKVIAISNRKGGVGKTTLALNIANEIRRLGIATVLIDLDSQCDLTKSAIPSNSNLPTILDVLKGNVTINNACHEVREDLYIIPGSKDLDTLNLKKSPKLLKSLLRKSEDLTEGEVGYVIIDTPPGMNDASTMAYAAANHVVLVTNPETFSMENMGLMINEIMKIKDTLNKDLNILGIAANKLDCRRSLAKKSMKKLRRIFSGSIFKVTISYDAAVPTAQNQQIPVRELNWRSKTVNQFSSLTREILERMEGI